MRAAIFADPITEAKGRERYSAQWYGLQSAFSAIERKSYQVTSSGNPIQLDMQTLYKVKGIGKETTINSKINIFTEGGKITKVEDKWDGSLPDSSIANVSLLQLLWPLWWIRFAFKQTERWLFWLWHFTWDTQVWNVRKTRSPSQASSFRARKTCVSNQGKNWADAFAGIPPPQRSDCSEDDQRPQECRRGC